MQTEEERNKKKKTEVTKVLFTTVFTLLFRNVQHEQHLSDKKNDQSTICFLKKHYNTE